VGILGESSIARKEMKTYCVDPTPKNLYSRGNTKWSFSVVKPELDLLFPPSE